MIDNDFFTIPFEDAWAYFKISIESSSKEYQQVRFGIKIKFDIYDYQKGRIETKPKQGLALLHGKRYNLEEIETELEEREKIMKNWLIDNEEKTGIMKMRELKK